MIGVNGKVTKLSGYPYLKNLSILTIPVFYISYNKSNLFIYIL